MREKGGEMKYTAEEVRARFEAWALGAGWPNTATVYMRNATGYAVYDLQKAWECWQAAYAERIKADEGANDRIDFKGMWNAMSDRAYAHLPAQAAQAAWAKGCGYEGGHYNAAQEKP